uniref:Uncharacterized protein n=1 Tax=Romanomermis culicivorax TaxID=13658 RepID=A0A915KQV4_ROMCU
MISGNIRSLNRVTTANFPIKRVETIDKVGAGRWYFSDHKYEGLDGYHMADDFSGSSVPKYELPNYYLNRRGFNYEINMSFYWSHQRRIVLSCCR